MATIPEDLSLTEAIAFGPALYSHEKLPPTPGRPSYKWKKSEDVVETQPGFKFIFKNFEKKPSNNLFIF